MTKNCYVLSLSDKSKQALISPKEIFGKDSSYCYIWYSSIEAFVMRKGLETILCNMLGTMIKTNFLPPQSIRQNISFCNTWK
ncbi:MAG: hypothetical protein WAK17_03050 [Candidatus Nitrosopolaris sp.]